MNVDRQLGLNVVKQVGQCCQAPVSRWSGRAGRCCQASRSKLSGQ